MNFFCGTVTTIWRVLFLFTAKVGSQHPSFSRVRLYGRFTTKPVRQPVFCLREFLVFLSFLCLFTTAAPVKSFAVPAGTTISSTASATYTINSSSGASVSNNVVITTEIQRTYSALEILQYAPLLPDAELIVVNSTDYDDSSKNSIDSKTTKAFTPMSQPMTSSSVPIDISTPVPLAPVNIFHKGEAIFFRLTDMDQNINRLSIDSVVIQVATDSSSDIEHIRLTETGNDTGVFTGYIQSVSDTGDTYNNGELSISDNSGCTASYTDVEDTADNVSTSILVDPYGIVFDSMTGMPLDGVTISIVNSNTGDAAVVYGDDGVSTYPNVMISGSSVSDSSGKIYNFPPGGYRFPYLMTGEYRFIIQPQNEYSAPSIISTPVLQSLPSAPFAIAEPGSRGESFRINPGPAIHIDIPVDPKVTSVWIKKNASKETAAVGDFIQYSLNIENTTTRLLDTLSVIDILPFGLSYQKGSARQNNTRIDDPVFSRDGLTLGFPVTELSPIAQVTITYIVEVGAGTKTGKTTNTAFVTNNTGVLSNTATAEVTIDEDFFMSRSTIMGRVIADNIKDLSFNNNGIEGAKIYLEDGTYVVTDKNGMYHFEGVKPGTHVLQLDTDSLPKKYQAILKKNNTRFAGEAFSRFIDIQPGSLWKADFHVAPKPRTKGNVKVNFSALPDNENNINYNIKLFAKRVPLSNARLSVLLPENAEYVPGSSRLNGIKYKDPHTGFGTMIYRIGDIPEILEKEIKFKVKFENDKNETELSSKCILTFNTPVKKNQRTESIINVVGFNNDKVEVIKGNSQTSTETTGLRQGELGKASGKKPWEPEKTDKAMPAFSKAYLNNSNPGLEWLWPKEDYGPPIPSIKIAVKHTPHESLTLLLNGNRVSRLNYEGIVKNSAKTIAVSKWRGVDLIEGDNTFEVITTNGSGEETGRIEQVVHYAKTPAYARLIKEKSFLIADGKTSPVIAVKFTDIDGYPARDGIIGEFDIDTPHSAFNENDNFQNNSIDNAKLGKNTYHVLQDGIAYIKLEPTSDSGEAVLHFPFENEKQEIRAWIKPGERDWILVGFAEGTAGYNTLSGNKIGLKGTDDKLYSDGQVSFFAKGKIKGEWLTTISYNSENERTGSDGGLFQGIDPDKYYNLYADNTEQQYAAQSSRQLYIKVEKNQFYAMFGDFDTGLTVTELSKYSRSLNGVKSEMKTDNFSYNVFASETGTDFVKDEIQGDGTSGLYHLSRDNIAINSEKIIIETRDRFRSEQIISTEILTRHIDYTIDYNSGALFFKSPVFSKDSDMNPIYIVAEYETGDITSNDTMSVGGRGAIYLLDKRLEVGGTCIYEDKTSGTGILSGIDTTYKINKTTKIKAEVAISKEDEFDDTQKGNAYLAEIIHISDTANAKAYFRESQTGFGLGQQNGSEAGMRKIGADGLYYINNNYDIEGKMHHHDNLATGAEQDHIETTVTYYKDSYSLYGGLSHTKDLTGDDTRYTSDQFRTGASKSLLDNKLNLRIDHEQSVAGNNGSNDYPTRTVVGADYQIAKPVSLFAEHEMTSGENQDTSGSRAGLKATPWKGGQLNSSIQQETIEKQTRVYANLGLNQVWQINSQLSISSGLDHSRTVKETDTGIEDDTTEDFTAISLGANFREKTWFWDNRVEYRVADSEDKWGMASGIYSEPVPGIGLSAATQIFRTDVENGDYSTDAKLSLGFAYRPLYSDITTLNKTDFILEDDRTSGIGYNSWRIINNLNSNIQIRDDIQLSLQLGLKYVVDTFDTDTYSGFTDLLGLEARYDINERFDIGVHGRVLHTWNSEQSDYNTGLSFGTNLFKNVWISLGYNIKGFSDKDFSRANYTAQGPFMKFRIKFDQESLKDILKHVQ